jgi:hypothetical protein
MTQGEWRRTRHKIVQLACEIAMIMMRRNLNECHVQGQRDNVPFSSLQVIILLLQFTPRLDEIGCLLLEYLQLA